MTGEPRDKRGKASRARSAARLAVVQALYEMELTQKDLGEIILEFETYRFGEEVDGIALEKADSDYFRAVLTGVMERQCEIDRAVNAVLAKGWPLTNVDSTIRAIFRAGGAEMLTLGNIPIPVVISEYVDVAKAFFEGDEPRFTNGVLDALARRLGLLEDAR